MRKFLSLLLAVSLMATLSACSVADVAREIIGKVTAPLTEEEKPPVEENRVSPQDEKIIWEEPEKIIVDEPLFDAKKGELYGYINTKGEFVIEPKYYIAMEFSEGVAAVKFDGEDSFKLIDKKGDVVGATDASWVDPFCEGLAVAQVGGYDGKYGYIDKSGKMVISAQFDFADDFSEGMAIVKIGDKFGFIDKTGNMVVGLQFDDAGVFSEGMAAVLINGKYGYIDKTGNFVIEPKFSDAGAFSEGLAPADVDDKTGYINTKGEFVIEPQFYSGASFSEGFAVVTYREDYQNYDGIIDKNGNFLVKPEMGTQFDSFCEGLAKISRDWEYGFIDKTGKIVIPLQYEFQSLHDSFKNGLAYTEGLGERGDPEGKGIYYTCGYINTKGEVVYSWETFAGF